MATEVEKARLRLAGNIKLLYPTAVRATVVTDHSHDEPHGHIGHLLDADGKILVEGSSSEWHDNPETIIVDEAIYDWYYEYMSFVKETGWEGEVGETFLIELTEPTPKPE